MTTEISEGSASSIQNYAPGHTLPLTGIEKPGCYFCHDTGHLVRVAQEQVATDRTNLLITTESESGLVTFISENPFIPRTRARLLAANLNLEPSF